ncbi:MAG TPA: NADP-dependent isocitrate dehydrogenase [Spirochaetia bacterium]|nr:NADP-dependent isocitrate dehydrogenase [Spirochaetia bacterium]
MKTSTIYWTKTDEAPALAAYALLPVIQKYTEGAGIAVETADISLAGRILAIFPDRLTSAQQIPDYLAQLGELAKTKDANIIKLPNISASIPQLQSAIKELREKGFDIPEYPEAPNTDEARALQARFAKVLGSSVNPVLREGNSDRRPAPAVRAFALKNPHKMMKDWPKVSKTRVAHMDADDFYGSEKSITMEKAGDFRIEFVAPDGSVTVLRESAPLKEGEILDAAVMRVSALRRFYRSQIDAARDEGVLLSLHLKATMMKISDPIMFGHAVSVFFAKALEKHSQALKSIGVNLNNGLADVFERLDRLPQEQKAEIEADIEADLRNGPSLAMVDSRRGITNLHRPNDVIVDASMPVVVRDGGRMWNVDDELRDCIAVIPDRSYATMYREIIEDCKRNGQFDPATMGDVSNVGLMAQKAEEYGSHDKTFEAPGAGTIRAVASGGNTLLEQEVERGDIFRMCQTKDAPVRDWVRLAVARARATGSPAVFWLDDKRAHDREIKKKVERYLPEHETSGLDIRIMNPVEAMKFSVERVRRGEDAISVTGNVLRDYLTDLFPILELGTSARMLSIVPLLNGGGLFETGAGGSAPKHVQQFLQEGHLRWDSLGEYCALVPSFEMIAEHAQNPRAAVLAKTLNDAIARYLEEARSPSRNAKEIDNRGSTFYLSLYWAQALAKQGEDTELQARFSTAAKQLESAEAKINGELLSAQGSAVDIGGYYLPDSSLTDKQMRPSATFNAIIDGV